MKSYNLYLYKIKLIFLLVYLLGERNCDKRPLLLNMYIKEKYYRDIFNFLTAVINYCSYHQVDSPRKKNNFKDYDLCLVSIAKILFVKSFPLIGLKRYYTYYTNVANDDCQNCFCLACQIEFVYNLYIYK